MLIIDDNDTTKEFNKLDAGDLFRDEGEYYMKILSETDRCNAVALKDGRVYLFTPTRKVEDLGRKYLQVMED